MNWRPPRLHPTRIEVTAPVVTDDPLAYARRWLPNEAIAVVERHATVQIVPLCDVAFDDRTTYVHAFSEPARCDIRAARVAAGWLVDAVREGVDDSNQARVAWARPGRHLCLGKALQGEGGSTPMQEARIRPYRLPLMLPLHANACIEFVDYYAEDADSGDLRCIAHRAVAIRELSDD
jgi:hypothetical protein